MHLPLIDLGEGLGTAEDLCAYTATAAELGYSTVSANDHLVWQKPWLDGPTALTTVAQHAGGMTLATSVALPAVRHPVVVAKWLTTLGCLTDSRVVAGLGPGSSRADYAAVGVPFEERWTRFDEGLVTVRSLVRGEHPPAGRHYVVPHLRLEPLPARAPEVWAGSWGSDARLRSMATVADGWLASAYNTTPERFKEGRARLDGHLRAAGRDPSTFPDLIATMWTYVTDDPGEADHLLRTSLAPVLRRDPDSLAQQLLVGSPAHCLEVLRAYVAAGAQQILLWPIKDPIGQLRVFAEAVRAELDA